MAAGLTVASIALYNQIVIARTNAMAASVTVPNSTARPDLAALASLERSCLGPCPTQVLETASIVRLAAAARQPGDSRGPLIKRARADLKAALKREPLRGSAAIQLAYATSLDPAKPSPTTLALIGRSYEIQPFSKQGALWRVRTVTQNWPAAPPALRAHALDEAIWFSGAMAEQAETVTAIFEESGLELTYALRRAAPRPRR